MRAILSGALSRPGRGGAKNPCISLCPCLSFVIAFPPTSYFLFPTPDFAPRARQPRQGAEEISPRRKPWERSLHPPLRGPPSPRRGEGRGEGVVTFSHGSRHGLKSVGPPGLRSHPALSFVICNCSCPYFLLPIPYSLPLTLFLISIAFNADKIYKLERYIAVIVCRVDC
jgi:hypothetical protein